jgi:Multiubiquitin
MSAQTDKHHPEGDVPSRHHEHGQSTEKFEIRIEEKDYPWGKATITVIEIRTLGNIPADQCIVVEDVDGRERTLRAEEVVTLVPGHRVGRAPKYKRG